VTGERWGVVGDLQNFAIDQVRICAKIEHCLSREKLFTVALYRLVEFYSIFVTIFTRNVCAEIVFLQMQN
jgi:hypothetical protein